MAEAPETLEGWYILHDFRSLDGPRWFELPASERQAACEEAEAWLQEATSVPAEAGSGACYAVLGHKADLLFLHLRPTLEELSALERGLDRTRLGRYLRRPFSYLSVVELSGYLARAAAGSAGRGAEAGSTAAGTAPAGSTPAGPAAPGLAQRLHPHPPGVRDMPYLCFYPMNKRRTPGENWYTLPMAERQALMRSHGEIGARYADRVKQVISGSMGLDDWEWGVTLFASDPVAIKKLLQEMRFDEASARYAEFGPFYAGWRLPPGGLMQVLVH